jgi:hypothetical protein
MSNTERVLAWLAGSLLSALGVSWLAFQLQQEGFAPAVLFPLLVGTGLGGLLLALHRYTERPSRRAAIASAVLWGLLAVVGQDYIGHRRYAQRFDQELARQHPLAAALHDETLRPGFLRYLADRVGQQPLWWTLEALLTSGAAAAVVALGARPTTTTSDPQA